MGPPEQGERFNPGMSVGRYLAIGTLGRGGMGVVLRAYDPKLQREVALKVLRTEAMSERAQARMIREARAMAKLSHPNVVAVYDVDAEAGGRVVLAMEYVQGTTMRAWLKSDRSWREVLSKFTAAGRGLAAAHGAGLLHRDFKPANVLLGEDGRVKVGDFGLARSRAFGVSTGEADSLHSVSTGPSLSAEVSPDLTQAGAVLGTPAYMAPEQHTGEELDASADQYSFCLALWRGLVGSRPFRGSGPELGDAKLAGPPSWPREVAVPKRVAAAIRRGLSPRPRDRWPSMEALLDALSIDTGRRAGRWVVGFVASAAVAAAAVAWAGYQRLESQPCSGAQAELEAAWGDERRDAVGRALLGTEALFAVQVWSHVSPRLDAYASQWAAMHKEACEATTVRGEQSERVLDLRMACLAGARLELQAATDVLVEADSAVVERAHRLVDGLPRLARCSDVDALGADVAPPATSRVAGLVEQVRVQLAEARALRAAGKYQAAEAVVNAVRSQGEALEYAPLRTEVDLLTARILFNLGRYEPAAAALRETLERGLANRQWRRASRAAINLVETVGVRLERHAEGLAYASVARGLAARPGAAPADGADLRLQVASVLRVQGKYVEAEAEQRAALTVLEEVYGAEHQSVATARNNLANSLYAQGKYPEAIAEYRTALTMRERLLGKEHPANIASRANIAGVLYVQGKADQAEQEYRAVLGLRLPMLGPDHPDVATVRYNLAAALRDQSKTEESEEQFRAALAGWQAALGPETPNVASARAGLGVVLQMQERYDEAQDQFRQALALRTKLLGADHPHVAWVQSDLAQLLWVQGRKAEALPLFETAWRVRQRDTVPAHLKAETAFGLARAVWAEGKDRGRALELARVAASAYESAGQPYRDGVAQARAWIAEREG